MIYYLYPIPHSDDIFAYTPDKKTAKKFEKMRVSGLFVPIIRDLDSEGLKDLYIYAPDKLLTIHKFKIGDEYIEIPMTANEWLTVQHTVIQGMEVDAYITCAKYPKKIFTKKFRESLRAIGYLDYLEEYNGSDKIVKQQPDYLSCFVTLYGETLKGFS